MIKETERRYPKMLKKYKTRWVKALRSGKYLQGQNVLKFVDPETKEIKYCCLGLQCEINGIKNRKASKHNNFFHFKFEDEKTDGFPSISYWNSLFHVRDRNNPEVVYPFAVARRLASDNDNGVSFEEIADWIEENL